MKPQILQTILAVFLLNLFSVTVCGQDPAVLDTGKVAIQAIPVTDIIIKATDVNTFLREKRTLLLNDEQKQKISGRLDTLLFRLAMLREDPRIHKTGVLNLRSLENLQSEWSFLDNLFETEQTSLNKLLQAKEVERAEIGLLLSVWEITSQTISNESTADLVLKQIKETLNDIRETHAIIQDESKFLQEELVSISSGVIFTNQIIEEIILAKQRVAQSLFSFDSPPIWKEFARKKDTIVFHESRSIMDDSIAGFRDFHNQNSQRMWLHLILSLTFLVIIYIVFRNLEHSIPDSDNPEIVAVKKITEAPLASGILISLILTFILYSNLHESVFLLTSVLLLPPMIIILRAAITGPARKYIYLPLVAIIMVELHRVGYSESLFSRLWLMMVTLFGIMTLALIFGRKSQREAVLKNSYGKLLLIVVFAAFILLFVAFFCTLAGALILAEFLTQSVIESVTIALFVYALAAILHSILTTVIYSDYFIKSSILSLHKELIFKRLKGLINLTAIVLLINFTFRIFGIWDSVYPWLKGVLTYTISVGTMAFSLWNIILFFFILWFTIWISRFVRSIFETEEGLRDRMSKGAPGAVSLLLRISIISIGFMLAIAAAGVKMDKLAFLMGAFGVGIGFGLQNIFNNLVSGIILAFERPIKEGDIIEVGALLGTVREIGIRSSIIRTYDGSEVIVPNGNLISNELINWTHTDMRRRGEVLVGVAYGTDPQKVLDLLLKVAKSNERVLEHPEPQSLFLGFGDSSLNFRLLFWMADADQRFVIQSEIAVKVNYAIIEAGIEIPFPQRDLHVRSVDPRIMDRIKAQDEISKKQIGFKKSDENS